MADAVRDLRLPALALDEAIALAVAHAASIAATAACELAAGDRVPRLVPVLLARGARAAEDTLIRAIPARDRGAGPVTARFRRSGGALLGREARAYDEPAGGLDLAAGGANRRAVGDAALVRVVLAAADEAIPVAAGDDAGALRAERRRTRVAAAVHAPGDLLARGRPLEALPERVGRRGLREPPVHARARVLEARRVLRARTRRDARARLRDRGDGGRILQGGRSGGRLRGRLLAATRGEHDSRRAEHRSRRGSDPHAPTSTRAPTAGSRGDPAAGLQLRRRAPARSRRRRRDRSASCRGRIGR